MIVVIDTNVWISALQFAKHRGTPTRALEKAISEDVIATCDEIDAEIVRVLTEKFSWEQPRATSALQVILARGIRVKIRGTVKECRDPGDDMFQSPGSRTNPRFTGFHPNLQKKRCLGTPGIAVQIAQLDAELAHAAHVPVIVSLLPERFIGSQSLPKVASKTGTRTWGTRRGIGKGKPHRHD